MKPRGLHPRYSHTQTGWVLIFSLVGAFFICAVAMMNTPLFPPWPVALILGGILPFFYNMTVTVDDETVMISMGVGLIRKKIELANIASAEKVTNRWWYGYGVRIGWGGVMYNVSGLQAVNLMMKDGYLYRIGTDDPEGLLRAVNLRLAG